MHCPQPAPSQPRGSMVGVFWLRHIPVREGFGCNTQQLGYSFCCNTLQFKLGSQCEIREPMIIKICLCMRVCPCLCAFVCFLVCLTLCVSFTLLASVLSLSTYFCVCRCLLACLSAFLSVNLCLPAYTCLCVFICVCDFLQCMQAKTPETLLGCIKISFYNI